MLRYVGRVRWQEARATKWRRCVAQVTLSRADERMAEKRSVMRKVEETTVRGRWSLRKLTNSGCPRVEEDRSLQKIDEEAAQNWERYKTINFRLPHHIRGTANT